MIPTATAPRKWSMHSPRDAFERALQETGVPRSAFARLPKYPRDRASTEHRTAVWARMRALGLSYPEIAAATGTGHTTIIGAVRRAAAKGLGW